MPPVSAALLCYRDRDGVLEVLIVHPGGPYFVNRDAGVWSIPKGLCEPGEELLAAACREFAEETGSTPPSGSVIELGEIRQRNGKRVVAFGIEADGSPIDFVYSNEFELEWPPHSGNVQHFPECDRGGWYSADEARSLLVEAQREFVTRLQESITIVSP